MNFLIPCLFLIIAAIFFISNWLNHHKPSQENVIVGIFGIQYVSYCIIFQQLNGFLSVYEIFNSGSYMVLMYAGTIRTIKQLHSIGKKTESDKLFFRYILCTWIYMVIDLIFLYGIFDSGTNAPLKTVFFICPLYTHVIFFLNLFAIHKNRLYLHPDTRKFEWAKFLTSYCAVSWLISLYEWFDLYIILTQYKMYAKAFAYYPDPTYKYDIYWLIFCIIALLLVPRLYYIWKYKIKGE